MNAKLSIQGPAAKSLNEQVGRIIRFIRGRLSYERIGAVRTDRDAGRIVNDLITVEFKRLEKDRKYRSALEQLERIQNEALKRISTETTAKIQKFVANVSSVDFRVSRNRRYDSLARTVTTLVDDGVSTPLEAKGDGVKSLVALSMMQTTAGDVTGSGDYIVGIEEPESHLHPDACHQLRATVLDLSTQHQVIVSSHSPLFVNRLDISGNIIVGNRKAKSAKSVAEIRECLGVRRNDDLFDSEVVLLCEGPTDVSIITKILSDYPGLPERLSSGRVAVDYASGSGNFTYKKDCTKAN